MKGADRLNFHRRGLFQQRLHLGAELAHDAEVVAPRLAGPALGILHIQRAELAQSVGGEQHLVRAVIGDDHLRPVYHGGRQEGEGVAAQRQRVALAHHQAAVGVVAAVELLHHPERRLRGHHHGGGVGVHKAHDVGAVIRLHVLHHQIVRRAALQRRRQAVHPLLAEMGVHRVHHGDLLVQNDVGVVGHAQRHVVLPLKQCHLMVVDADIPDIVADKHEK